MPQKIKDATNDLVTGAVDEDVFQIRRGQRRAFQVHHKEKSDAKGRQPVSCPARGNSQTATCPVFELRMSQKGKPRPQVADKECPRVEFEDAPQFSPDICRQRSVPLNAEDGIRREQGMAYRSEEWGKSHKHARNSIAGGDHNSWYQLLWAAANRMLFLVDPHPAPRNHNMTAEEHIEWRRQADQEDAVADSRQKLERINWICKRLVTASVKMLPRDIWDRYQGNFAGDATKVRVAGSPNPTDPTLKRNNPDPSSGRYRREGSHEGTGARTDDAAYELEKAVMVWNKPGENTLLPSMCVAVSFHRPGSVRGHAFYLTKTVQEEYGFDRILTIWDRLSNDGQIDTFAIPMRKLGVELVVDYKAKDVGVKGHFEDLIMLDGNWHAGWMPKLLISATADLELLAKHASVARDTLHGAKYRKKPPTPTQAIKNIQARSALDNLPTEEAELRKRIAARDRYRMIPKGMPDVDGYQRFSYPAAASDLTGTARNTRSSITVPLLIPNGTAKSLTKSQPIKYLQKFTHESETWAAHYGMRSLVEASNNLVKLASAEDLGNAKKRSGRGFAFHYLASTLAVVSSNIRRIITFFTAEAKRSAGQTGRTRRRKDERGEALARKSDFLTEPAAAP